MKDDIRRYCDFMRRLAQDDAYDQTFRTEYDRVRRAGGDGYESMRATTHSIWRVNGANRQLLDEIDARMARCDDATRALFASVRTAALVRVTTGPGPSVCALGGETLAWPCRVQCDDAAGATTLDLTVGSDVAYWVRCYNVVAHFANYTRQELREGGEGEQWLVAHRELWRACVDTLRQWSEALGRPPTPP